MKGLRFLNCASRKNTRSHIDGVKSCKKTSNGSDLSFNDSNPSSTGDCSIVNKNIPNGSTKDSASAVPESSICRLNAKSSSLANESIDTSKINLLPSDSCSVLMKQSIDRISNSENSDIYRRLDAVVRRLERLLDTNDLLSDDHSGIIMFNEIMGNSLAYYVELSSSVEEHALEQAKLVKEAFDLCLNIMQMSRKYSKPSTTEMSKIMQPLSFKIFEIADVANRNRAHPLYQPLLTIADSVSILSWINMSCSAVFVKDVENATKVSANATTQMYRESAPLYAEWMRAWLRVISSLRTMVCDFYPVGLIWQSPSIAPQPPPPSIVVTTTALRPHHPGPRIDLNSDVGSISSGNSRRKWKRQEDGKAFNRDALLTDISRTCLGHLNHVDGFSYNA